MLLKIDALIDYEKKTNEFKNLPFYCSSNALAKRRPEFYTNLGSGKVTVLYFQLRSMLILADKYLDKIIHALTFPPRHITYDASKDIARTMIKVMKARKIGIFK